MGKKKKPTAMLLPRNNYSFSHLFMNFTIFWQFCMWDLCSQMRD